VVWPWGVKILSRPNPLGRELGTLHPEDVVVVVRDVVGRGLAPHNHVWNELEKGYVYSSHLQPVRNILNAPLTAVPPEGVWAEVSVPYVDARKEPQPDAPLVYRLYYSAIFKIAEALKAADGSVWYRVTDETGLRMYTPAEVFHPISPDEVTPVSPNVEDKRIVVYLKEQALTAFEGAVEVFRARLSSGALYFGEDGQTLTSGTPSGAKFIWQKRISRHMTGGTREAGYDLPGVGWVTYFASNGAALHATYWHNDYGTPKSHGCLNLRPEDAKWLFRWTAPAVAYQPGDVTVQWANRGTLVDIRVEA
jgi:lipoprotein-anchoring transpeptidase ErfK/SrfK